MCMLHTPSSPGPCFFSVPKTPFVFSSLEKIGAKESTQHVYINGITTCWFMCYHVYPTHLSTSFHRNDGGVEISRFSGNFKMENG
ncbi:hypothetical protein PNOK_0921200 [Pyrrhoderma noxium]|uniref:Uncharacterized protein n=1 Tax=Pyrrhoderma noxium TaxID=2282107 RepID=A0A286U798_9AGAM|nr:hypothetical protein PNOK_0921200 [Pyrrhoderma noxium]